MDTIIDSHTPRQIEKNEQTRPTATDGVSWLGYLLLAISAGLYGIEESLETLRADNNITIFFLHYFLALVFVVVLIVNKSYGMRRSWRKDHIHKTVILLNLFLVSAYALNREIAVFENSITWFCYYILLSSAVMMSYRYFDRLPSHVNCLQHLLLGCALVLYFYMTIFVANFYILGSIGILLLGVGMHIFVPLLLLLAAVRLIMITHKQRSVSLIWLVSGILVPIAFATGFVLEWNGRVKTIDRIANQSVIHADTELPVWVKIAQTQKNDWITERILKSDLVYTTSNKHFQWDFFSLNNNWDEARKHDPLVFIASANNSALSIDDRKHVLMAITDSRSKAEQRFWAGNNLTTSYIVTDVDLYPELHIAYSEHYLNIKNNTLRKGSWWNSEEAIYTFQLPEGSVVTSLSLWINGKEEKGILTSKQKAAEAYNTIVGRDMRDPSLVQWKEGNTISVRVFPCTPQEERKVKIGITSPLPVDGDKLVYQNVTFRGPDARSATQATRVRIFGKSDSIVLPDHFEKNANGEYISERVFDPDLQITMKALPIAANQFSFSGFTYSLSTAKPTMSKVDFKDIYVDINNSWTEDDLESISDLLTDYQLYAYFENDFIKISPENWNEIAQTLKNTNFSLFPFHHIKNNDRSLVITKGKELSPHLADFNTSAFAEGISKHFSAGRRVYVFNLEGTSSTYIKSLKELRAFYFAQGSTKTLLDLLQKNVFPVVAESDERIMLHESQMVIEKTAASNVNTRNTAPDHLARLFAYNNIMRQVGSNFFKDDFIDEKLVDEASTAYVVSPVSSLIVLETKEDYERFGIKDKEDSLHNASKNSSGAVPEPHEWALIVLFLIFAAFQLLRNSSLKMRFFQK